MRFEGHYHGWLDPVYTNGAAHGVHGDPRKSLCCQTARGSWTSSTTSSSCRGTTLPRLKQRSLHGDDIAAVIMEPVAFNACGLAPYDGYLDRVRELCTQHGVMLIFDEVVTGFRLAQGGAQELYGVVPDLAVFAKAVSGGLPLAMVAGTRLAMASVSDGRVGLAGTFTGNPFAIAAADAVTELIGSIPNFYDELNAKGSALRHRLQAVIDDLGSPVCPRTRLEASSGCSATPPATATRWHPHCRETQHEPAHVIDRMARHGVYALPRGLFFLVLPAHRRRPGPGRHKPFAGHSWSWWRSKSSESSS